MPLTDAFSLTPVTIDFIDGAQSRQRLQASPDDVNGRGVLVTFVNCDQPADLTGQTPYFAWKCHDTGYSGALECEEDYAPGGRFKVKFPKGMLVPGTTVLCRFIVPQDDGGEGTDNAYSSRIFEVEVGEAIMGDPFEGENDFTLFAEALVELRKGVGDLTEWSEMAKGAAESAEEAALSAQQAADAANEALQEVGDAAADARDAAGEARQAATDVGDAVTSANDAADAANTAAEAANEAASRLENAADRADASADAADDATARATASADAADDATTGAIAAAQSATTAAAAANDAASRAETGEDARELAETDRADAEDARAAAEEARAKAEAGRVSAEDARAEAEREREEYATQLRADVDAGVYDGATFTPLVSPEGVISWTNDKERDDPDPVDIKGPKGDTGEGLNILDAYDSLDSIRSAHPDGNEVGDGYMGGSHYYVWNGSDWADCGELKGEKGDRGEPGENATTTELASVGAPGLLRQLSGSEDEVLLGNGEWGEYRGGGSAGPLWLEVDEAGDLYAYYDDNYGEPNLEYEEGTGNLYAIFETEA